MRRLFWFAMDCAALVAMFLGFLAYKFLKRLTR